MAARTNDLANVVERGVVRLGDVDFSLLLRRLVIGRSDVSRVHSDDLIDESQPLLVVLILQSLLSRVLPQPSLAVVHGLWRRRPNVSVVLLVVLRLNARLQVIYPVPAYPDLYLSQAHLPWKVREALRGERLIGCVTPALSLDALAFFLPPGDAHRCWLIIACFRLAVNVFSYAWQFILFVLRYHIHVRRLLIVCRTRRSFIRWLFFRGRRQSHRRHGESDRCLSVSHFCLNFFGLLQ